MAETIPRKIHDPDAVSYAALRKDGVALAQELSGKIWTDYNTHDPGVTILEQFCFGLSELAYRSGFPIADYFTQPDGRIDFSGLGFYLPEEIFPCAPITKMDFCRYLFSKLPSMEDVSIPDTAYGLHSVMVRPYVPMDYFGETSINKEALKRDVAKAWYESRNLCEDLQDVVIRDVTPCYLDAEVEIHGRANAAEVLAEIYFKCARLIASDIQTERYDAMLARGVSLQQAFTGPLSHAGYLHEDGFHDVDAVPSDVRLISEVHQVPGVLRTRSLSLVDKAGKPFPRNGAYPFLVFAVQEGNTPFVRLVMNGHNIPYTVELQNGALRKLRKLEFEYRAYRAGNRMREQLPPLPQGEYRDFGQYSTIREHFPNIYGVGAAGLARSMPEEYHRGARQLKEYLTAPEQVLADSLQTIAKFPELLALQPDSTATYFSTNLASRQLLARMDDALERKHRLLDQALAIYGVEFPRELWMHLHGEDREAMVWMLECKRKYLEELRTLSYARSQATHWMRRIELLLGLREDQRPIALEPILLRRRSAQADPRVQSLAHWLVLSWRSERIADTAQQQVEEYVRSQVPAHVLSLFIWLNEREWTQLEQIHQSWNQSWSKYCALALEPSALDQQSQALLVWLDQAWKKNSMREGF